MEPGVKCITTARVYFDAQGGVLIALIFPAADFIDHEGPRRHIAPGPADRSQQISIALPEVGPDQPAHIFADLFRALFHRVTRRIDCNGWNLLEFRDDAGVKLCHYTPEVEVIYRQRLTGAGKLGALIAIAAPIISGVLIGDFLNTAPYGRGSAVPALFFAAIAPVGWILVLIGREYYDATVEAAAEAEQAAKNAAFDTRHRVDLIKDAKQIRRDNFEKDKGQPLP